MGYLFLTIIILTISAYYLNGKELIAPSFLFSVAFLVASFFALLNGEKWGYNLNNSTYFVIVLGILEFIIISYIIRIIFRTHPNGINKANTDHTVFINNRKLIYVEIIQFIFVFVIIWNVKKVTGQSDITKAVNMLNYSANGFIGMSYELPTYAKLMQNFNFAVGIFGEYLFIKELVENRKFKIIFFIEVLFALSGSLLSGSRGGTLIAIVSLLVFYMLIQQKRIDWNPRKNLISILLVIIISAIVLFLFKQTTTWVGRGEETRSSFDYISIYMGAEIKNLDLFINNGMFPIKTELFGQQTFVTIYYFLIKHLNYPAQTYNLVLPFQSVNGYGLGNVYTVFYPWLYDFGYSGILFLTLIMASISEIIYEISIKSSQNIAPYIRLFYGGTVAPCIVFSFFSNRFFEAMNIITIIVTIVIYWFINHFLVKEINKNE